MAKNNLGSLQWLCLPWLLGPCCN